MQPATFCDLLVARGQEFVVRSGLHVTTSLCETHISLSLPPPPPHTHALTRANTQTIRIRLLSRGIVDSHRFCHCLGGPWSRQHTRHRTMPPRGPSAAQSDPLRSRVRKECKGRWWLREACARTGSVEEDDECSWGGLGHPAPCIDVEPIYVLEVAAPMVGPRGKTGL